MNWIDHPAFQGGIAPLAVALVVGAVLGGTGLFGRTPVAWLCVVIGYLASTWLASGIAFSPLTAGRKIVLVVVVSALVGLVADLAHRRSRAWTLALVSGAALAAVWTFVSVLLQREPAAAVGDAAGIALFTAATVALLVRGRDDGLRTGATGVGLGVATGVCAVLSASVGFLMSGVAVAAGAGAMLLVQVLGRRTVAPGYTGTIGIAVPCALFALGSTVLAEMPAYVAPVLLLVPIAVARLDPAKLRPMARASALVGISLAAALVPIAVAWFAARNS